jgi:NADH-quinone oxidoreductase subunit G
MRTDWRRGKVLRRLAGDDPEVNEEWNCDKGRWGFQYATAADRLTTPMVRDAKTGLLRDASWPEALARAAEGLRAAKDANGVGVLTGGRLTVEDAYAYSKFARVVLGTNDIDFRARPLSEEESAFLASNVVGATDVTYADVEAAPAVVLVGLEPEEECPILFLRLRKAYLKRKLPVYAVAPFASPGLAKIGATVRPVVPGGEAQFLVDDAALRTALGGDGAVLLVGERLAAVPGGLSAAAALAEETGARLAWVPRRAGDRGAVEVGCLPNLLPGGRFVGDPGGRAELVGAWGLEAGVLPSRTGRDTDQIIAAAAEGQLSALVVAGVDPADLSDVRLAERAIEEVGFLVSFELRNTAVAQRADVVFPIAPVVEKPGTFLSWEGRPRTFEQVLRTPAMSDARALDALAAEFGVQLGCADAAAIRAELGALTTTRATRPAAPATVPAEALVPGKGEAVLATWHHLLDLGSLTDGDEYLLGTARTPVARISKVTAADLAVSEGDPVTVSTDLGRITLPAAITDLPDGVVWLPMNSPGSAVLRSLGVTAGATVALSADKRWLDAAPTSDAAGGTR